MRGLRAGFAAALAMTVGAVGAADAAPCKISLLAELKVEPGTRRPVVSGRIGDHPITILLDTGAWASTLTEPAAARLKLRSSGAPVQSYGAGGTLTTSAVTVTDLHIGSAVAPKMLIPVSGSGKEDMLLGDEFFNDYDVEFDLKGGVVRLLKITDCADDQIPYWSKGAYSLLPLVSREDTVTRQYIVPVKLNGRNVNAEIDSGAFETILTPQAAMQAHATVTALRATARGASGRAFNTSDTTLATVVIGDETAHNVKVEVGDMFGDIGFEETGSRIAQAPTDPPEMLLGADFLLAHHVLLSVKRAKVYFTYVGGPMFVDDAARTPAAATPAAPRAAPSGGPAIPSATPPESPKTP